MPHRPLTTFAAATALAIAGLATAGSAGVAGRADAAATGGATAAPSAVIRVDQVGYATNAPKVALLMSTSSLTGTHFTVKDGNTTTFRGTARANRGAWSTTYPYVYPLPFSHLTRSGTYTIDVRLGSSASGTATSPPFRIAPAPALYADALGNAVSFYENERDGPHYIASALRTAPAHLNDEHAMTYSTPHMNGNGNFKGNLNRLATGVSIDASGGWFDAGDYLKFVETTSYVVDIILQGTVSFPTEMGRHATRASRAVAHDPGSRGADFVGEGRHGLEFLLHMWNERTKTLYYQVGVGEVNNHYVGDHDIWRLPQDDDTYGGTAKTDEYIRHPPVFRAGHPGSAISPNIAGRLAAAFALGYRVFRTSDPKLARRSLRDAGTVFRLAGIDWHAKHLLTAAPWDFYPETSWQDDMELGATELALAWHDAADHGGALGAGTRTAATAGSATAGSAATPAATDADARAARYLRTASYWANRYATGREAGHDTLNLYDVSALADYELDLALRQLPAETGLDATRADLIGWLGDEIRRGRRVAKTDPFRFGFAWDQWDTTAHGAGLSVMASEYDALTHSDRYARQAQGWLDNILGENAWGVSLIVGDGTTYPDCMQHQVANLAGSLDGKPPILAGAAVEGPNSSGTTGFVTNMRRCPSGGGNPYAVFDGHNAVYVDNVQSYSTDEPAIDLTVLTPLAFGWRVAAAGGEGAKA